MLAGAHWVLRIVTGRQRASEQARTLGELPGMRRRRAWALSVQQTLDAVSHCQPPWWQLPHPYRDFPPLLRREVVWACRPALLAVVGAFGVGARQDLVTGLQHGGTADRDELTVADHEADPHVLLDGVVADRAPVRRGTGRNQVAAQPPGLVAEPHPQRPRLGLDGAHRDRKSTRLNSSHV